MLNYAIHKPGDRFQMKINNTETILIGKIKTMGIYDLQCTVELDIKNSTFKDEHEKNRIVKEYGIMKNTQKGLKDKMEWDISKINLWDKQVIEFKITAAP